MTEEKDEAIRRLAYVVWQDRCRRGDPCANDEKQNWLIAKHCLYPEYMEIEDLRQLEKVR
jgi:hypothetical protein